MTDTTLSEALKEAYASAPSAEIIYHTLEINHPDFTTPILVVRDTIDLTAFLEDGITQVTYVAFAFDIVPPEVQATQMPMCKIEIDNVSRDILAQVELAIGSPDLITVTYRQYLSSDLSGPQNDPPLTLTVFDISANVFRITATCGYGDFLNKRFPSEEYAAERFPGLIAS